MAIGIAGSVTSTTALRLPSVSDEEKERLEQPYTIVNRSNQTLQIMYGHTSKEEGSLPRLIEIPPMSAYRCPARLAFYVFGDPKLRVPDPQRSSLTPWTKEVGRVRHRIYQGNEQPGELFFDRYLLTAQIRCPELLAEFMRHDGVEVPDGLTTAEAYRFLANKYYGSATDGKDLKVVRPAVEQLLAEDDQVLFGAHQRLVNEIEEDYQKYGRSVRSGSLDENAEAALLGRAVNELGSDRSIKKGYAAGVPPQFDERGMTANTVMVPPVNFTLPT